MATIQNSPIRAGIANVVASPAAKSAASAGGGAALGSMLSGGGGSQQSQQLSPGQNPIAAGQQAADTFISMFDKSVERARKRKMGSQP